jgi:demethylmenaquinone methyltransferase/2-methoxy-6-polyprenyl-1,4-benzoquinol methylase
VIEARGSRRALIRAYDLFSYLYSSTAARLERAGVNRGLARLHAPASARVLEVAVGTGLVHARLAQRLGPSPSGLGTSGRGLLVGTDLSNGMLRATQKRVPEARLARADARQLPFAAESFDLVWSSYLLDLIPTAEMTPVLSEFRRVLRPGGQLVLVNFSKNGDGMTWWERLYAATPTVLVPWLYSGCRPVEAAPFVRAAGFREVEREFVTNGLDSEVITAKK